MSDYDCLHSQSSMAFDERRNAVYLKALEQIITPESVVLDVGAGLGILGLQAAKLGAKKVYLVEPEDLVWVGKEIAKINNLDDRVVCLQGTIESLELPEKVDVIISVFTGNFLLGEDLLPSLFFARDNYLKPGGTLLPDAAVMEAAPINAPALFEESIDIWSQPHLGIDQSPGRAYASQNIFWGSPALRDAKYLAEPSPLMSLDFYTATSTHCQTQAEFAMTQSGLCHGFAGWFKMHLGDEWLSTGPHAPPLHWSAAYLPLDPPLAVQVDDKLPFQLTRPTYGDWTWQTSLNQQRQQHSTFFSGAMSLETLRKNALDYCPKLKAEGNAALYVLTNSNGTLSVNAMAEHLVQHFPNVFPELLKATNFVQSLTGKFSD